MPKVLLVEDEKDIREAIATALTDADFEVLEASDGAKGVVMALKEQPDVIVMDINMPAMSGHEVVEKLRQDSWGKKAKILFLTAFSDAENVVSAVAGGSAEYIVKSNASLEEIVQKVKQVYHGYQS